MTAAELRDYWISYASFSFLLSGVRFKDPQFSREREWRVFCTKVDLTGVRRRPSQGGEPIAYLFDSESQYQKRSAKKTSETTMVRRRI